MFEDLKEVFSFGPEISGDLEVRSEIIGRFNELTASEILVDQVVDGFEQQLDTVQSRIEQIVHQTNTLISGAVESVPDMYASLEQNPEKPTPVVAEQPQTQPLSAITPYELLPSDAKARERDARARIDALQNEMAADNSQFAIG